MMIARFIKVCAGVLALSAFLFATVNAQTADATFRVNQLEEQIRQLNGKVEELTFQLLQLQELVRKMQEDSEFRFQELENRSDASQSGERPSIADLIKPEKSSTGKNSLGKLFPPKSSEESAGLGGEKLGGGSGQDVARLPDKIDGVEIYRGEPNDQSLAPKALGTIIYNGQGEIVDSGVGAPIDLTRGRSNIESATKETAAVQVDPDELYALGYTYVLSGNYPLAEKSFRKFINQFPNHRKLPDANFWLGESHFARGQYEQAAQAFLTTHRNWPDFRLGAQALLKLGISVAGLDQRELACATFAKVPVQYPNASNVIMKNVRAEQRAARCALN